MLHPSSSGCLALAPGGLSPCHLEDHAMTQNELDHAVARATGESVSEVRRMGFQLIVPPPYVRPTSQAPHIPAIAGKVGHGRSGHGRRFGSAGRAMLPRPA
jgi:hypothetical protein